jgi:autotransporter translocation and assembly factor TamB
MDRARQGRPRRIALVMAKAMGGLVAFVVVALAAFVVFLSTDRGHEVLRRAALARARKVVPGLTVARLQGNLLHGLTLRGVDVRDDRGQPAAHADVVTVRYRLWPLRRHEVIVDDLQVHGLRVDARPDPRGGLNLNHLAVPGPPAPSSPTREPEGKPWTVSVARVLVGGVSGQVVTPDGLKVALDRLDARGGGRLVGDELAAWASVHAEARSGTARATVDAAADVAKAAGEVTLGRYDVGLRVADLDPAAFAAGAPDGRLSMSVNARGVGLPLAPHARADVELRVAPSELADVRLLGGRLTATLDGDRWEVARGAITAAGASLTVAGHGQGQRFVADADARLDGGLARALGPRDVRGHGRFLVHAEGIAGGALTVRANGRVDGLAAGDARVGQARLSVAAHGTPDAPAGTVRLTAERVTAGRGAPAIDRLNLALDAGRGGLKLLASARGPRLRATVGARGTATARAGDLTIDQVAVDFTTPAYRQRLALMQPARLRYRTHGDAVNAALAGVAVRGEGARFTGRAWLDGELSTGGRAPEGRLDVRLARASAGGSPPLDAQLHAALARARGTVALKAGLPGTGARLQLDAAVPVEASRRGPPRLAARGPVSLRLTSHSVRVQEIQPLQRALARQGITGGTMSLDVSATGDIARPEVHGTFDLRDVMYRNIAGLGRDSRLKTVPGLGGSVKVDAKDGAIAADLALLIRGTGVLKTHAELAVDVGRLVRGESPADPPLRATLEIPNLRLASLAEFTDGLAGVDGVLHGRLDVTGTVKRPSGHAELAVDAARVDKLQFKQVRMVADAQRGAVRGHLTVEEQTGGRLDGKLALERSADDRLEAYLTAKDLDVSFARVFLPGVRELGGVAQLSVTAKGTPSAPRLWGSLSVENGRIGVIGQPTFRDARLAVALEPGRLDLNRVELTSGDGKLQGSGRVTLGGPRGLTPRAAVLTAHAHSFLVAAAGSSGARIDGDLAFEAALREDVLAGTVSVPRATVWLSKTPTAGGGNKLQKVGQHADVHFVDATAQAAAARALEKQHQAAAAAIRVAFKATASPVYVRGKDLDLEVRSNVRIGTVPDGPHRGAVTLDGAIHIPRGHLDLQGQRFEIDHGDVRFDGSWDVNPALDIKLTRQFPEALVAIELRGTPRKPQLKLTSDPGIYDQSQIVSLILTGQPGGQPTGGKSFDATSAVATAVLSRLADQVAPELGLDVLRVEKRDVVSQEGRATGSTDTRVEVGKYVTERIYLSYAHVFGAPATANQNEARVEYRMTRRWMLETVFGDAGQGGVDALWAYRF